MERTPVVGRANAARLPYQSLSERLQEAQKEADREPDAKFVGRLYDHLYRLHFRSRCRRRPSAKTNTIFGRLFSWALQHEVDLATFIAANMTLMKPRLGRYKFQPNMLSGPNAEARYNGYLSRATKRYRRGHHDVFVGSETWIGRIREAVASSEAEIGDVFVRANLAGSEISWSDAIALTEPSAEWDDFHRRRKCWLTISDLYDTRKAEQESRLAQLRAAWWVAEGLQHGLPNRIGFTEFSWASFLDLMRQVLPESGRELVGSTCVSDVPDVNLWGNWDGV